MTIQADDLKTEDICNDAVRRDPYALEFVPDDFKTEDICNDAVRREAYMLKYVPDHFKTEACALK